MRLAARFALTALLVLLIPAAQAAAQESMREGIAFITSVRAPVTLVDSAEKATQPELHAAFAIEGQTIRTGKGGYAFIALSNGVAIGIHELSEVRFEEFQQAPFDARKESREREPSVSKLSIHLKQGTLAVASKRLSPLSEAWIDLPFGGLRIHSATCVLHTDARGIHLTAYTGSLTYYYPEASNREFITAPQSLRISEQSAQLNRVAETPAPEKQPESWKQLADATRHASQRVFFKADTDHASPQPLRIVPSEHFEQAPARPYEFKD